MKQIHEILSAYFAEHPADMGMSDADSVLEFLYAAYCDAREADPPESKTLFLELGEYLEKLPLSTNNAMFFIIIKLCTEHERRAFEEGIRWGLPAPHRVDPARGAVNAETAIPHPINSLRVPAALASYAGFP